MTTEPRPRYFATQLLSAWIEREDPASILAQIANPASTVLAKALAQVWFEQVQFHARTYSKDRHSWRLIPTGMKPRVWAYLYQRANA